MMHVAACHCQPTQTFHTATFESRTVISITRLGTLVTYWVPLVDSVESIPTIMAHGPWEMAPGPPLSSSFTTTPHLWQPVR